MSWARDSFLDLLPPGLRHKSPQYGLFLKVFELLRIGHNKFLQGFFVCLGQSSFIMIYLLAERLN
jgi:hypothetical protein